MCLWSLAFEAFAALGALQPPITCTCRLCLSCAAERAVQGAAAPQPARADGRAGHAAPRAARAGAAAGRPRHGDGTGAPARLVAFPVDECSAHICAYLSAGCYRLCAAAIPTCSDICIDVILRAVVVAAHAPRGTRQASESADEDETNRPGAWAGFASRLRAEVRARLPDPQALVAAHSALVGRGSVSTLPAAEPQDVEMAEAPDGGNAVETEEEVVIYA